jgi:hypothetical protein
VAKDLTVRHGLSENNDESPEQSDGEEEMGMRRLTDLSASFLKEPFEGNGMAREVEEEKERDDEVRDDEVTNRKRSAVWDRLKFMNVTDRPMILSKDIIGPNRNLGSILRTTSWPVSAAVSKPVATQLARLCQ